MNLSHGGLVHGLFGQNRSIDGEIDAFPEVGPGALTCPESDDESLATQPGDDRDLVEGDDPASDAAAFDAAFCNNHMVSTEYRRHLRIQSMKVWVLLVAISAIFITTAAVIIG